MNDRDYLLQALALAQLAQGQTYPNPAVGCVIVREGEVLATGYHQGPGTLHAERIALISAQEEVSGATAYVTLEPCCHTGRTPPCTDILIEKKIKRVVFGFYDPNPLVKGKSGVILKEKGIVCEHVALEEINLFYRAYAHWWRTKTPYVTAKIALSADYKVAGPGGQPVAMTGEAMNRFTHQQRLRADCLLTTSKTVVRDDPKLNVRLDGEERAKPVVIIDRHGEMPIESQVLQTAQRVLLFQSVSATSPSESTRIEIIPLPKELYAQWPFILKTLGERGFHHVWVEAGPTFFAYLYNHGGVNEAYLYFAPVVLGSGALPGPNLLSSTSESQPPRWEYFEDDVCLNIVREP